MLQQVTSYLATGHKLPYYLATGISCLLADHKLPCHFISYLAAGHKLPCDGSYLTLQQVISYLAAGHKLTISVS
jgi:hypothetical protein